MRSLTRGNVKTAIDSVRGAKWRSLLTMLGIIIGIVSVVTVVSIGEGVKQAVATQTTHLGKNLITIRPGQIVDRDRNGKIIGVNLFAGYTTMGTLSSDDATTVSKVSGVSTAVPLGIVSGPVNYDNKDYDNYTVIGTSQDLPQVLNQKIAYGDFFSGDDSNQNGVVIGSQVAKDVFGQDVPLGQSFNFRGQSFIVRGVFSEFKTAPLSLEANFNKAIFIPYQVAQDITANKVLIYEILAKPNANINGDQVADAVSASLKKAHGGQQDFTVLKQDESVSVTSNILNLLTRLIAGIAAISLLVGGIGIMNVMLVSVTERMQEIGIRKAIGATSRQIMLQFMIEASVLSFLGGVVGVLISLLINGLLRLLTSVQPVITWQIVALAAGVSLVVGIIFGTAPALKAARKDPIDALRNS